MRRIITLISFVLICLTLGAQSPKREVRATWLATVWQLDWPKSVITETGNAAQINTQKKLMIQILDSLVSANMNSVCFQIRSRCDAMYQSKYEPWSTDLVASRGMDPGYDPLAFVIEEGHKRGLEVHAWLNPYRYESVAGQWTGRPGDYRTEHPDWVLTVNDAAILDPGRPEVQQRITDIIEDIITKYDLDGVLFDDYFYLQGITTQDAQTYAAYNPEKQKLNDWRRSNVNKMIKKVYDMIQETKPYVRFGISPAGIWDVTTDIASSYGLGLPAGISGGYQYNGIYSDPVAWLQQGSVDYISPQIYWTIGSKQDYKTLSYWWSDASFHFGKHFYSSHTISDLSASLKSAQDDEDLSGLSNIEKAIYYENKSSATLRAFGPSEVINQVQVNRDADKNDAPGSIFFATSKFYTTKGFINKLKENVYQRKALLPAIHWKEKINQGNVTNINVAGNTLSWTPAGTDARYAVYAIPSAKVNDPSVFNHSDYFLGLSYTPSFAIPANVNPANVRFAIATIDRYSNEYAPVIMGEPVQTAIAPTLIYPDNRQEILVYDVFKFEWNNTPNAISYTIDLALDADFNQTICSREITDNEISIDSLFPYVANQTHYWRVKSKTVGSESNYAEIRSFTPVVFNVVSPQNFATNISLAPQVSVINMGPGSQYQYEIATDSNFNNIVYSYTSASDNIQLPENLLIGMKKYYVRAKTIYQGENLQTQTFNFTTIEIVPDVPVILSPAYDASITEDEIIVKWQDDPKAAKFRIELCASEAFSPRQLILKSVNPFTYETTYSGLAAGTYYIRARAEYNTQSEAGLIVPANTEWSDTILVKFNLPTGIDDVAHDQMDAFVRSVNGEKQLVLNLNESSLISVAIYSVSGVKLSSIYNDINLSPGENVLPVSTEKLPKGFYFLTIETKDKRQLVKFVN